MEDDFHTGNKTLKVSVIVPVYKAEKYLRWCVDSLVNQTLRDQMKHFYGSYK